MYSLWCLVLQGAARSCFFLAASITLRQVPRGVADTMTGVGPNLKVYARRRKRPSTFLVPCVVDAGAIACEVQERATCRPCACAPLVTEARRTSYRRVLLLAAGEDKVQCITTNSNKLGSPAVVAVVPVSSSTLPRKSTAAATTYQYHHPLRTLAATTRSRSRLPLHSTLDATPNARTAQCLAAEPLLLCLGSRYRRRHPPPLRSERDPDPDLNPDPATNEITGSRPDPRRQTSKLLLQRCSARHGAGHHDDARREDAHAQPVHAGGRGRHKLRRRHKQRRRAAPRAGPPHAFSAHDARRPR